MLKVTIRDVFNDCQKGLHSHGRLVNTLNKIYMAMDFEEFWTEFVYHLKYSLVVFKREPVAERSIEFISKFALSARTEQNKNVNEKKSEEETSEDGQSQETEEEMDKFLLRLFNFLLQHHNARDRAVRFRCCQLVNKLLNNMGEDAQIDDDLYENIYQNMLQRLRDTFPIVRIQAIFAISRLQDSTDPECQVTKAYLFLMGCDLKPDVRRAVLSCIAASTKTLPAILERTRDTKDVVRKLAYQVLAQKVHVKALTIAQRVRLLHDGLNDRETMVQDTCANKLLQAWLATCKGNVLDLLRCLDVENSMDVCKVALKALFKNVPPKELVQNFDLLNEELVMPRESLSCESALYWRCLCEHLKSLGAEGEEQLDKVLPTGTAFCKYMEGLVEKMKEDTDVDQQLKNEFMMQQLLTLAGVLDLSDEVGRKHLDSLVRDMLSHDGVSHMLVQPLLARYQDLYPDADTRISQLVELISEIREPLQVTETALSSDEQRKINLKIAEVRVELNQLREDLDECIRQQDFAKASEVKERISQLEVTKSGLVEQSQPRVEEVRTEKNDPQTLLKCLTITSEMLQDVSFTNMTPTLHSLVDSLVLPSFQNEDPAVRNMAVKSLGLCCQLSKDTAKAHLLLFVQVSQMDQELVKGTALHVIFDLLHTFGLEFFQTNECDSCPEKATEEGGTSNNEDGESSEQDFEKSGSEDGNESVQSEAVNVANSLVYILSGLLDSESSEIRTVAAEGLAKLLLSGRVVSPKLLSRLLLVWYNPLTEEDSHLRHCLGIFFPVFAFAGRCNQEIVEEAFMPTLRTLFNAPSSSPLADVNINNVAELLVQLTSSRHLLQNQNQQPQENVLHDNLAVKVCNAVLSEPHSFHTRMLCKVLNMLELTPTNATNLKDLLVLADNMMEDVKDKQCTKSLGKFRQTVQNMLNSCQRQSQTEPEGEGGETEPNGEQATETQPKDTASMSSDPIKDGEGDGNDKGDRTESQTSQDSTVARAKVSESTLVPDSQDSEATIVQNSESSEATTVPDSQASDITTIPDSQSTGTTAIPDSQTTETTTIPDSQASDTSVGQVSQISSKDGMPGVQSAEERLATESIQTDDEAEAYVTADEGMESEQGSSQSQQHTEDTESTVSKDEGSQLSVMVKKGRSRITRSSAKSSTMATKSTRSSKASKGKKAACESNDEEVMDGSASPVPVRQLRSKAPAASKAPVATQEAPGAGLDLDSEMENSVFASPTPVRRVVRSRKGKAKADDSARQTLEPMLTGTEAQSDTETFTPRSTRRKLGESRRMPLSDLDNEAV